MEFVDSLKYLGVYLKAGKMFSCSYQRVIFKFYAVVVLTHCIAGAKLLSLNLCQLNL